MGRIRRGRRECPLSRSVISNARRLNQENRLMGGPIIRSGATPEFSKNWDRIFGAKQTQSGTSTTQRTKKAEDKPVAQKADKKAAKKTKK
jgi:hypothetical protein